MKGQLTTEFLLVMLIFISVLALWLPTVLELQSSSKSLLSAHSSRIAIDKVSNAINNIYILGPGNSKQIEIYILENAELHSVKNKIYIETKSKTFIRDIQTSTKFSYNLDSGTHSFLVTNKNGKVEIKLLLPNP